MSSFRFRRRHMIFGMNNLETTSKLFDKIRFSNNQSSVGHFLQHVWDTAEKFSITHMFDIFLRVFTEYFYQILQRLSCNWHVTWQRMFENNHGNMSKRFTYLLQFFLHVYVQNARDRVRHMLLLHNVDLARNVKANGMCLPSFPCYRTREEPKYSTRGKSSAFHAISRLKMRNGNEMYSGGKTEKKRGNYAKWEIYICY